MGLLLSLILIVGLLLWAAYLSASETALLAASPHKLHQLKKMGNTRASIVEYLQTRIEQVIGSILIYNHVANILASSVATGILIEITGDVGIAYATIVMSLLIIFFTEIVPKTIAVNNAEKVALRFALFTRILFYIATPIAQILRYLAQLFFKLIRVDIKRESFFSSIHEELRGMIDYHLASRQDIREEHRMLNSILDLSTVSVAEIIVHRKHITMIDIMLPPSQILDQVLKSPYTRLPLWKDNPDNIIGILHAKDLLRAVRMHTDSLDTLDIAKIATKPWFIPETTSLLDQLKAFREKREHFALVVDEYGALLGTVTLEDILEEIVGDITDEHDINIKGVSAEADSSYLVSGFVTIRDLNRQFGWSLPDGEASTIAGLLLYETGRIPEKGQIFLLHGFRVEIVEKLRNQLTLLRIWPPR